MRKQKAAQLILAAVALLCYGAAMGQQQQLAKPSQIPGIKVLSASDREFASIAESRQVHDGFAIKNESSHAIVAIQFYYGYADGKGLHVPLDGMQMDSTIKPGGVMFHDRKHLYGFDSGNSPTTSFEINWLLFDDGTFYGPQKDADELMERLAARKKFIENYRGAMDKPGYLESVNNCARDPECKKSSPQFTTRGWSEMSIFTLGLRASGMPLPGRSADLEAYFSRHEKYPTVRRVIETVWIPEDHPHPLSPTQWQLSSLTGTCRVGGSQGARYDVTGTVGTTRGCQYDTHETTFFATGEQYYNVFGFSQMADGQCTDVANPGNIEGTPVPPSDVQFFTPAGNYDLYPRWMGTSLIEPTSSLDGYIFARAFGYVEAKGPFADPPGSNTITSCWMSWNKPYGAYAPNTALNQPPYRLQPGMGIDQQFPVTYLYKSPFVGGVDNTQYSFAQNNYGYMTDNYEVQFRCANQLLRDFPMVFIPVGVTTNPASNWYPMPLIWAPSGHEITCKQDAVVASGPPPGDPGTVIVAGYCNCLSQGGTFLQCQHFLQDPVEVPACWKDGPLGSYLSQGYLYWGDPGSGGGNHLSAGYSPIPVATPPQAGTSSTIPTSKIGVWRWGTGFITNNQGSGDYEGAPNDAIVSFSPPGGVQQGDVPVVGDWAGTGRTCAGYVRTVNSTLTWYLDANCNGVWDDPSSGGGDYFKLFGYAGMQPIVGDWTGSGKSCLGVFSLGQWTLDSEICSGAWIPGPPFTITFQFGLPGDIPVAGKWAGASTASVGVVRNVNGSLEWILDAASPSDPNSADHVPGQYIPGTTPACGTNYTGICLTPAPFFFGLAGDAPIVGNWMGLNSPFLGFPQSFAGVYRGYGNFILDSDGSHQNYLQYNYGFPGDTPLASAVSW